MYKKILRRVYSLLLMLPALVLVFTARLLRPLVIIRFGRIDSRRIGALMGNTQLYLYECDASAHKRKPFDILYHYLPISNHQAKKMWERTGRLRIFPFPNFMQMVDRVNRLLPGGRPHMLLMISDTDKRGLGVGKKSYLSFTREEEVAGMAGLKKLGVADDVPFVCFLARDSAYLESNYPQYNWHYHDCRNSSIHNYVAAAEKMARRGYFAIRMGAAVKDALAVNNPKIIDYAINGRTDFMDIYLGAKCRFFICDTAGISAVPGVFKRPIAWVNYIEYIKTPTNGTQSLLIPKKFWLSGEKRFLTIREIMGSDIKAFCKSEQYEHIGIEIIENTPEEIAALAVEMDERLKGTWQTSEEDEELQRRFRAFFDPKDFHPALLPRIGTEFLRQNRQLLER